MKNDEWGAVAYLSQSRYGKYGNLDYEDFNKEIYVNNAEDLKTGRSSGLIGGQVTEEIYAVKDMTDLGLDEDGNKRGQAGPGASTTGTIYGIFDMSGGARDYVMVVLDYNAQGSFEKVDGILTYNSGFTGIDENMDKYDDSCELPNLKYYNSYQSANPTEESWKLFSSDKACNGGICYGHGLSETYENGMWYGNACYSPIRSSPWIIRGGDYTHFSTNVASIFFSSHVNGTSRDDTSCHFSLVP